MLKATLLPFYELIDDARQKVGDVPGLITDEVIEKAFPTTVVSAELEGCDRMLRLGVLGAVKAYIRKPDADTRQRTFEDVHPDLIPHIKKLGAVAYFVPRLDGGEHVSVPDLIAEPRDLDAARKFMRLKGEETLHEATLLDELYEAVRAQA
ncbi:hypothetical protein ACSSNL_13350 [Thalassobius sp. S69A]|uniref:hypothetical protein n=1 Tax=unclassified Thalassovita TaxID=2619711 RepID=UPI003C7A80C2